jgi:signal transduction histidine kinase
MDRWIGTRGWRVALDWFVPAAIAGIGIVDVALHPRSATYPGSPSAHIAFLTVGVTLLGLRRRAPLLAPVAAIVSVGWWSSLWSSDQQGPFEGFLVIVAAAYALGAQNSGRRLGYAGAMLVATWLAGVVITAIGSGSTPGDLVPIIVWQAATFGVGYLISRRTEQVRQAHEATAVLAADQQRQTARAIEDERARIARELHDVVAHGLSVIVVQAGAERRALHNGPPDLASLDAALGAIERAGREALVDLRRLLGLLRRTEEPAALAPQPGLAQLDDLLGSARGAGLTVELHTTGDCAVLPPGLDLTAYRIVQEALTNVLKHANARTVRVGVAFHRNHLELDVTDDGGSGAGGALATTGAGHGLIGMRERVSVFGGTVSVGPKPDGGWRVHSRLPLAPAGAR